MEELVVLVHLKQGSRAGRRAEGKGGVVERAGGVKRSAIGGGERSLREVRDDEGEGILRGRLAELIRRALGFLGRYFGLGLPLNDLSHLNPRKIYFASLKYRKSQIFISQL